MDADNPDIIGRLGAVFGGEPKSEPAEAPAAAEAETEAEDQAADQPEQEPESEEVAAEESQAEVEIEVEGQKMTKAQIAEALSKAKDYTQKTQSVAEERRRVEVERRLFQETQAFTQAVSDEIAQLKAIDSQLEQFRRVDLSQYDTDQLARMQLTAASLREDKAKLQESLQQKQGQFKQRVYQSWDEMTDSARKVITKELPDWEANATKIAEYALAQGFQFEAITGYDRTTRERVGPGVVDPAFAKALYKAWKWDQLQGNKAVATAKAKAAPVVKPGAQSPNTQPRIVKEQRDRLKKTGSVQDAQALLKRFF